MKTMIAIARIFVLLSLLSLLGAWLAQITSEPLFGLSQTHLFADSIALALLGIAPFMDAWWHARTR